MMISTSQKSTLRRLFELCMKCLKVEKIIWTLYEMCKSWEAILLYAKSVWVRKEKSPIYIHQEPPLLCLSRVMSWLAVSGAVSCCAVQCPQCVVGVVSIAVSSAVSCCVMQCPQYVVWVVCVSVSGAVSHVWCNVCNVLSELFVSLCPVLCLFVSSNVRNVLSEMSVLLCLALCLVVFHLKKVMWK